MELGELASVVLALAPECGRVASVCLGHFASLSLFPPLHLVAVYCVFS